MEWHTAIKPARTGSVLEVEVVPGSRESRFPAGFNAWRGRLEAKVRAPPEDGKANAELCSLVASALAVAPAKVSVSSGHTSRRKSILVEGLAPADVAMRLEAQV